MVQDEAGFPSLAFVQLLRSNTLDADAVAHFRELMAREGIDEATLHQRDGQVPVRWFKEVYPGLDQGLATEMGHAFAVRAQLTSFGPLSVPLVSAGSVMEIVELLDYLPLISTSVSSRFQPDDEGLTVWLTGNTGDPNLDCFVLTYCGSALIRLIEMLVGRASPITRYSSWQDPETPADNGATEPASPPDDRPISFLHVPTETLNAVCQFSDPVAYRHAIDELQRSIDDRMATKPFSLQVRTLLDEGHGIRSGVSVAEELSMSLSTLKRRLHDEGTTFQALRETSLRERATLGLLDRSVPISQIADDLGYSDLANFSHAFKRWTGRSPSQFRRGPQGLPSQVSGAR